MIKVVNVVQDFNTGGIQSLLLNLLRTFKDDRDIDFSVVVLEKPKDSAFDRTAAEERLKIAYLGCVQPKVKNPYVRRFLRNLSYDGRLLCFLHKQKPDIVHTHNTRMLPLILKCIGRTRKKLVWIHTLHSDPYAVHEGHIPRLQKAVNEYGVHPVCLNETQFEKAKERYGLTNCSYIYNLVSLDKFHGTLKNRDACREKLGIPSDAYVVGTVGRLDAVKNYRFLVRVFAVAAKKRTNAILVFTGDGDEAEALRCDAEKAGVSDRVRFLGIRKDTEEIYPAFDVFASTSITESSSLVILEAQATGLTCVVSAACPKESIISDKVVKMGGNATEEEWAEQLLRPARFAASCASEDDYGEASVKKSLIELYDRLAAEKSEG